MSTLNISRFAPLGHASLIALSFACDHRLSVTDAELGGDAGAVGDAGTAHGNGGAGGASPHGPSCHDGVRNGGEQAVDCGGPLCPACDSGNACTNPVECTHGVCTGGVCQPATCDDGVRNGDEEAVDCGGDCGPCLTRCQEQCAVSDALIPLGCDPDAPIAGHASVPRSNADASIVAFDVCDPQSRCTPLYWTATQGARAFTVTGGATLSGMSDDGQLVLISPSVALGAEALLFSADGSSVRTGLRPAPALLSADGTAVGVSAAASDAINLQRLPRGGQLESLGALPSGTDFVFSGATPDAAVVVGFSSVGRFEPIRYTAGAGLVLGLELPDTADGATINALSRDGQSFAGVALLGSRRVSVFRWTAAAGLVELGPAVTNDTPGVDPYRIASSDDGSVLAFSGDTGGVEEFAARRWTAAGTITLTPGIQSVASLISADGSVIIGESFDVVDYRSFVWTEATGARSIRAALEGAGVDLRGWTLGTPSSLSRDGKVALGAGTCGGIPTIYRMVLPE